MKHPRRTHSLRDCARASLAAAAMLAAGGTSVEARPTIQYFESKWETIERRMPDVFMAGYGAMWLPPAARADSSNFSVGFDVFDRFDLGSETNPTLYGSETSLRSLIDGAHRAGIYIYFDTVYNHNGFSDGYRGDTVSGACQLNWAIGEGGYPGFVMSGRDLSLPFDLEFRNICPSASFPAPDCNSDPLNCRIAGLIDIKHESNHPYIRHPNEVGNPQNIPYQQAKTENARYYPDQQLASPYTDGVKPFNLADPLAGDPTAENATGMLMRYTQWMLEVNGVDGFRLDAVKHSPTWFYDNFFDFAARKRGRDFWGRQKTPFSFGEYVGGSSDIGAMLSYHKRVTTPGSEADRTVLDFPLKFAMGNPCPVDWIGASVDAGDGNGQDGSAGVQFVSSHDTGAIGDPPGNDNLAYAHIMTRKGTPIVYYNAREFDPNRPFPNNNHRGDAFGKFGNIITTLVRMNNQHVANVSNAFEMRGTNGCSVAYELNNTLLVVLNGNVTVTAGANGFQNVTLQEQTGNSGVSPTVTLGGAGSTAAVTVPAGSYAIYTINPPNGTFGVDNVASTIPADPLATPDGIERLTAVDVVTADTAQVRLQIDQAGALEDNALIKWNYGVDIDGSTSGDFGITYGVDSPLVGGFEDFTSKSVSHTGGTGTYTVNVDLTDPDIPEGYNYLTAIAFLPRTPSTLPPIYREFRKVIYVDRLDPDIALVFPPSPTGIGDINTTTYGFVVDNPDGTGNSMHYFWNLPAGSNPVTQGLLNGSNKATKTDRNRYRFTLNALATGNNQRLTLVLFEETGNYALGEFNIGVSVGPASVGAWQSYGKVD